MAIDILSRAKMVHKTFNSDSVGLIMNVPVQLIEQVARKLSVLVK